MSTTRPALWPIHDALGINLTTPEVSLYFFSGYPGGLPVPSADHNGKLQRGGDWHRYLDFNGLRNEDWLDASAASAYAFTATSLTYNNGDNVLTTGAAVLTRGACLVAGTRIETDATFLNFAATIGGTVQGDPLIYSGATTPGRIWVYANDSGEVRFESGAPATADAPAADEITLVGVDIDALGVVTDGAVAPTTLPLPSRALPIAIDVVSTEDITAVIGTVDRLVVNGGLAGAPSATIGSTAGQASCQVTGNGTQAALLFPVTAGPSISANASGAVAAIGANHTGAGDCFRALPSGAGRGMSIQSMGSGVGLYVDTSGGSGSAIDAIGPSGSIVVSSTADTGAAFLGTATSSGIGVAGLGGANAASLAIRGESTHDDAYAIQGLTTTTANPAAAGVLGSGRGAGAGVYANAIGTGYGLIVAADQTTPTRAAMVLSPQDADPTTPLQGDLLFNDSRGPTGKLRTYTALYESVHSSDKGFCRSMGVSESGSLLAGNSTDLSLAQITPEEVGEVEVTVIGHLDWSANAASTTVQLRDDDANATINGGGTGVIEYPIVGASGRAHSFCARFNYTLPDATTRTFSCRLTAASGTTTYTDVTLVVNGVY